MDRQGNPNHEHVIDVARGGDASSSGSSNSNSLPRLDRLEHEERPSTTARIPASRSFPSFSSGTNSRSSTGTRRGEANGRRRRSPLNSGIWISIESVFTACQIIASVIVLSLSTHEKPHAPLFTWVIGYASGCVVSLPLLYWRYLHRNRSSQQDSRQQNQGSLQVNPPSERNMHNSVSRPSEEEDRRNTVRASWIGQNLGDITERRLIALVDHLRMALDCFFAVWFVVGNVWIFGRHSSAADAPNLYRLCLVFLTFSCIGYAMPFLLCATICCCFPCIISFLGFHEDVPLTRGAEPESIIVLPTYKFKLKRNGSGSRGREINAEGVSEGGILAAGTEKEREISGEDAVCCICLGKYVDNDELRELPCTHFFHTDCVDKWLKINASCPLCKSEVGESSVNSSALNSSRLHVGRRVFDGLAGRDAYGSSLF